MNSILDFNEDDLATQFETGKLTFGVEAKESGSETSAYIRSWANAKRGDSDVVFNEEEMDENGICSDLKFEVVSARTIESPKKHVAYTVMVRKDVPVPDAHPSVIERRYTEFLELYKALCKEFPTIMVSVSFPKKALMGNFTPEMISSRSASFEALLKFISENERMKNSNVVINFLQSKEQEEARKWILEKRYDQAIPLLENCFRLINKLQMDRHPEVLRTLCLLVACCEAASDPQAEYFAEIALRRYEAVSDADLLKYYVPLLQLCVHLFWSSGRDKQFIEERLSKLKRCGIKVEGSPSLLEIVFADQICTL